MATLKKSRLWAAKEAYKAASNNYINQLSKRENNHLKNGNLLAKKAWAEQKLKQETARASKTYADNKNKLKYWWASIPWRSLERVAKNQASGWLKNSDAKWTAQTRINNASKKLDTAKANYRAAANEAKKTKVTNSAINNTPSVRSAKINMDNARSNLKRETKAYKKYLK